MKKSTKIIVSIFSFIGMSCLYEYYVKSWAENAHGAVIRADIFIVYPVILLISIGIYFILKKIYK